MMNHEDIAIEIARLVREAEAAVIKRIRDRQLGEAFLGLNTENDHE